MRGEGSQSKKSRLGLLVNVATKIIRRDKQTIRLQYQALNRKEETE